MKICILGDTHFGMRNDSQIFFDYAEEFYTKCLFPYLKENNITTILQLGDFWDRRKYINFNTLKRTKEIFLDFLSRENIELITLLGNHDVFYKNSNEVNSSDLLLSEYKNVKVINTPQTISIGSEPFCIIPWICSDNYNDCIKEISNTTANFCVGHFEINGFMMYRGGHLCNEGLDASLFRKFEYTFSGHYHHKSSKNDIHYVGSPMEMTWMDYKDDRGFHIFDLDNRDLVFYKNPFIMHHRLVYNDADNDYSNVDVDYLNGKYVKVVVVNKTSPYTFDRYMDKIYSVEPADVNIVEDFTDLTEGVDDEMVNQAEDTLTILNKTVDTLSEDGIDNGKLKNILRELYIEANNIGVV